MLAPDIHRYVVEVQQWITGEQFAAASSRAFPLQHRQHRALLRGAERERTVTTEHRERTEYPHPHSNLRRPAAYAHDRDPMYGPGASRRLWFGTGDNIRIEDQPIQWHRPNVDQVAPGRRNEPMGAYASSSGLRRKLGSFVVRPESTVTGTSSQPNR